MAVTIREVTLFERGGDVILLDGPTASVAASEGGGVIHFPPPHGKGFGGFDVYPGDKMRFTPADAGAAFLRNHGFKEIADADRTTE